MKTEVIRKGMVAIGISLLLTSCGQKPTIIQMPEARAEAEVTPTPTQIPNNVATLDEIVPSEDRKAFVHVCGEVNSPGVYELPDGSRIFEAIEAAGGFTGEAYQPSINLADKVSDGQQVLVPTKEEAASMPVQIPDQVPTSNETGLVNINRADVTELQKLSGIGEAKAQEILQYRESKGQFNSIEEIKNVNGIGAKLYEKIKENITVD